MSLPVARPAAGRARHARRPGAPPRGLRRRTAPARRVAAEAGEVPGPRLRLAFAALDREGDLPAGGERRLDRPQYPHLALLVADRQAVPHLPGPGLADGRLAGCLGNRL